MISIFKLDHSIVFLFSICFSTATIAQHNTGFDDHDIVETISNYASPRNIQAVEIIEAIHRAIPEGSLACIYIAEDGQVFTFTSAGLYAATIVGQHSRQCRIILCTVTLEYLHDRRPAFRFWTNPLTRQQIVADEFSFFTTREYHPDMLLSSLASALQTRKTCLCAAN